MSEPALLDVMRRAATIAASEVDIQRGCRRLARLAAAALDADAVWALESREDGLLWSQGGYRVPRRLSRRGPLLGLDDVTSLREVLVAHREQGRVLCSWDVRGDDHFGVLARLGVAVRAVCVAATPSANSNVAVLGCAWWRADRAVEGLADREPLLQALTIQLATMLAAEQRTIDRVDVAVYRERQQLARALHDFTNRTVLPLATDASLLARALSSRDTEDVRARVTTLNAEAQRLIHDVHALHREVSRIDDRASNGPIV